MAAPCILYKAGFKYQLIEKYSQATGIQPPENINYGHIMLYQTGDLVVYPGFAWDGPSGPTVDNHVFMRPSLVHDCFYRLFREGLLDPRKYRKPADELLRVMCREDGMTAIRAFWVYHAVRKFAPRYYQPAPKPVLVAPKPKRKRRKPRVGKVKR